MQPARCAICAARSGDEPSVSAIGAHNVNRPKGFLEDGERYWQILANDQAKTAAEWIKPAAFEECVKTCVKDGSEAVFVTEDNKILTFDKASVAKITPFLGRKVSVTGTVKDRTLKVDGITGLKM